MSESAHRGRVGWSGSSAERSSGRETPIHLSDASSALLVTGDDMFSYFAEEAQSLGSVLGLPKSTRYSIPGRIKKCDGEQKDLQ